MAAYSVRPAGNNPERSPAAVVVVHERRRLNPCVRDVVRRLAKSGFIAMGPDGLLPLCVCPGKDDDSRTMQRTPDQDQLLHDFFVGLEYRPGWTE